MRGLAALLVVAVLAFVAWVLVGGKETSVPDAPNPDLPLPDNPGEAADKTWDFIDKAPPWVWSQAAPIVLVGIVLAVIAKKFPKASYIMLGLFLGFIIFVVIMQN